MTAAGNDVIMGGEGNDTVTGGLGQNTFVFGTHCGKDEIVDFSLNSGNVIQFDHQVFADFADVKAHAHKVGFDVVIRTDLGDALRLDDVKLGDLRHGDFLFTCSGVTAGILPRSSECCLDQATHA